MMLAVSAALIGINALWFHFTGISYFPRPAIALIAPLLEVAAFAAYARGLDARAAFVLRNYSGFLLLASAVSVMTSAIQFTPFSPIDARIAAWDSRLGVSVTGAMSWSFARPWLWSLMRASYPALNLELFLVPLAADLFLDRRRTRVFLYAVAYSYIVGGLFYYLFPSSGPASILPGELFSPEQRLTSLKFHQVHHFQEVTTLMGGMVALPSFHAVWAILLTYAAAADRRLFVPVALLNGLVVLSTLLLGWHFLVDIAASALLCAASLLAAEATHRRLCAAEA
ncbi:MAG: phosphatase PAP2 family protein [Elusimicrobia bacterium]|nr:phosphatase PAP2 family protein [Elusimicrobiota bacterium]